jgi:hypothetical protein
MRADLLLAIILAAVAPLTALMVGRNKLFTRFGRAHHLQLSVDPTKDIAEQIADIINANRVVLFMKGDKERPMW